MSTLTRRRSGRPRQSAGGLIVTVGVYTLLAAVGLVFVVPLIWPIVRSFEPPQLIHTQPAVSDLQHLTLINYETLFLGRINFLLHFGDSVVVTLGTVICTGVLSTLAGYGFAHFRFRGRNVFFLLILAPVMVPFQAILTPMFLELHSLGLTDNLLGLVVVNTTFALPFGVFVMRNSFRQIPHEIEESAIVDGASTISRLLGIMCPLVVPGLITVFIYTFLGSWTEFLAALTFLTNADLYTLPVELLNIKTGTYGVVNYGVLEAGAVITAIPTLLIYVTLQRYYLAGFSSGAIKG